MVIGGNCHGVNGAGPYPDRPGQQDCIYYLRTGLCGYGTNCRYNHPNYASQVMNYILFLFVLDTVVMVSIDDYGDLWCCVKMQDTIYGIGGELPERDGEPDCAVCKCLDFKFV